MVKVEKKMIKGVVDKVLKFRPNILFVEKSVNNYATELLM
jgi:hypothetical protein